MTPTNTLSAEVAAGLRCLPMPVAMAVLTPFKRSYVRNNKGAVQKNVRCFPQCNISGHRTNSFCGSSVQVCVCACARGGAGGCVCVRT